MKPADRRLLPLAVLAAFGVAFLLLPLQASAAEPSTEGIDWFVVAMTLGGGLAMFLFGMEQMSSALKLTAGDRIKAILGKLSNNRLAGVATGAGTTAVVQSSSVTTVLVVGFVSAGLMSLEQSLGVILGANIGTTITAQIVAFKITKYSLLLVALGFIPAFVAKNEKIKQWGILLLGLGLVFFGMGVMSSAMHPLRSYEPFLELMTSMDNPLYAIAIAAAFTGLIQSSSATTGIVIVMATQGLISLEAGIALALGANIGTCITAGLAAIGKPREAVRAAVAHFIFNTVGVVLIIPFIPAFAEFVVGLGGDATVAAAGAAVPRNIANAHTIFNVGMAVIFLPFLTPIARFLERIVPDAKAEADEPISLATHLDESLADNPVAALEVAAMEVSEMGELVSAMLEDLPAAVFEGDKEAIARNEGREEQVGVLRRQIASYLSKVTANPISAAGANELVATVTVAGALRSMAHTISVRMSRAGRVAGPVDASSDPEIREMLEGFFQQLVDSLNDARVAFADSDNLLAYRILSRRELMNELRGELRGRNLELLSDSSDSKCVLCLAAQLEIIEDLSHLFYLTTKVAQQAGAIRPSLRRAA